MTSTTRRAVLGLLLGAGAGSLLAACSAPVANAPTVPSAATAAPKTTGTGPTVTSIAQTGAQPKSGGTLHWGMVGDIVTTDAVLWSPAANETTGTIVDTLVTYDDKLNAVPRLAESWELSSDSTKLKLNLRKGVQFHSGREFTSEDVNYNVLRVRDPANGFAAVVAPGSAWWTNIEMRDKYTVILTSDMPRPGVWDWLNYLRIQDREVRDGPEGNQKVGGTGPFKWMEWLSGDHINLARNTNYWDTGRPYLDEYRIQIFRDQQAMVAALEAGTLDVAALAPVPDAVRLKTDPRYQIIETHDIGQFFYAAVNAGVPPTDNKLLRQAIGYAIDRQRFTDTIMKGFAGAPKSLPWTASSPAYEAEKNNYYTFDLDKAKSLLDKSGLSNVEFDIAWATAGFSAEYAALAQIIQSDLARIGIKANLKPTEPPQFTQVGLGKNPAYNGMRLSAGAFAQLYEAASEFVLSRTMGYASNASGYYDPQYEAVVTSANTEPDAAKRKVLYRQINDYLLDAAYVFVLSAYTNIMAARANVRGMRWEPSTAIALRELWLA